MLNDAPTIRSSSRPRQEPKIFGFFIPKEEVFLVDQGEPINFKVATTDS